MRRSDFWDRLAAVFGGTYVQSIANDQVLTQLGGRTISNALAEGEEVQVIWRAVCEQYGDRVPSKLR